VHPSQQLRQKRSSLEGITKRLKHSIKRNNALHKSQLKQCQQRFNTPHKLVLLKENQTKALTQRLKLSQSNQFAKLSQKFDSLGEQLNLVSPLATINRGFAIARDQSDVILRSKNQVKAEQNIEVQLSDGKLDCTINNIK